MATCLPSEDGEITSDYELGTDLESRASPARVDFSSKMEYRNCTSAVDKPAFSSSETSSKKKSKNRSKKYDELSNRMGNLENLLKNFLDNQNVEKNEQTVTNQSSSKHDKYEKRKKFVFESSDDNCDSGDNVSLFAGGHISPTCESDAESDKDHANSDSVEKNDQNLSESARKCLFDIFGEDAVVKKSEKKKGIVLDKSQIEVIENGYRCKQPNYLSAFAEENFDLFPVDEEHVKFLEVPTLDSLIEVCLMKKYGAKASFSKGKELFTQPAKMIEKIAYKGQQAARLGLVIQTYIQQSLGNMLQLLESDVFNKTDATQMVKDIFAMSTKCLDQISRSGAFHHIVRRSCCMKDTGLHEQTDKWDYYNLPLSGDGVFGKELESLLKDKKEKRKQVEDLIPDLKKKRKFSGQSSERDYPAKRQAGEKSSEKPSTSSGWNNFRIPKLSRSDPKGKSRGRGSYGSGGYGARRTYSNNNNNNKTKPVAKTDEK